MPVFTVMVLGSSGSGKTSFFAAMHAALGRSPVLDAFSVRGDPATESRLSELCHAMTGPEPSWPPRNHPERLIELAFTSGGDVGDGFTEMYQVRFLDYDGLCLTDPGFRPTVTRRLTRGIQAADALLVVLDGDFVASLLRGEPRGRYFVEHVMAGIWERLRPRRRPVHFLITKWDLVSPWGSLDDVRRALLGVDAFAVVARRVERAGFAGRSRSVRLVPVSVLDCLDTIGANCEPRGNGFGRNGSLSPGHVRLPLLAVMADLLSDKVRRGETRARSTPRRLLRTSAPWLSTVLASVGSQEKLRDVLAGAPLLTSAALSGLDRVAGRHAAVRRLGERGDRIGRMPLRHVGLMATGLSLVAECALFALRNTREQPDGYVIRERWEVLGQLVRAYQLELDRFRDRFPGAILNETPRPGSADKSLS